MSMKLKYVELKYIANRGNTLITAKFYNWRQYISWCSMAVQLGIIKQFVSLKGRI